MFTLLLPFVLVGFILGYFLGGKLLGVITIASAVMLAAMYVSTQEAGLMVVMAYAVCTAVANLVMWITYGARKHVKIV